MAYNKPLFDGVDKLPVITVDEISVINGLPLDVATERLDKHVEAGTLIKFNYEDKTYYLDERKLPLVDVYEIFDNINITNIHLPGFETVDFYRLALWIEDYCVKNSLYYKVGFGFISIKNGINPSSVIYLDFTYNNDTDLEFSIMDDGSLSSLRNDIVKWLEPYTDLDGRLEKLSI